MSNEYGGRVTVVSNGDTFAIEALDGRTIGGAMRFVFAEDGEESGPVRVRVRDPGGKIVVERILRELPTRGSEAAAVTVPVVDRGDYLVEVRAIETLIDRRPTRDPWELDATVRRWSAAVSRPSSARVRVG